MQITDKAARALCAALSYDRRLILLSLRANQLTAESESEVRWVAAGEFRVRG